MRCLCACHIGSVGDRQRLDGVDTRDPIDAATACRDCLASHCDALHETALPNDVEKLERPPAASEFPMCWAPDEDGG